MPTVDGLDYRVLVSDDGTAGGTLNEVDCQGTLSVNFNRSANTKEFKNCTHTSISKGHIAATFEIGFENPLPQSHTDLWDHHDNRDQAYIEIVAGSGNFQWAGTYKVIVTDATFDDAGNPATANMALHEDGNVVRSVTP